MSLTEQVMAQVRFLTPELIGDSEDLLQIVCSAAVSTLSSRLRPDVEPADCQGELVTAAGMCAAAALMDMASDDRPEQFTAGDVTVRRGSGGSGAAYLRSQAAMLMAPYVENGVPFMGV
jgi:hypothetical protein